MYLDRDVSKFYPPRISIATLQNFIDHVCWSQRFGISHITYIDRDVSKFYWSRISIATFKLSPTTYPNRDVSKLHRPLISIAPFQNFTDTYLDREISKLHQSSISQPIASTFKTSKGLWAFDQRKHNFLFFWQICILSQPSKSTPEPSKGCPSIWFAKIWCQTKYLKKSRFIKILNTTNFKFPL